MNAYLYEEKKCEWWLCELVGVMLESVERESLSVWELERVEQCDQMA